MFELTADLAQEILAVIESHPSMMFLEVARRFNIPELAVLQLLSPPRAVALDHTMWESIIRHLTSLGRVRVLVSNTGTTMECRGTFGGFSTIGEYFNVQTRDLDLHIRWRTIAAVVAVEKPSHLTERPTASIQFFDQAGNAIMKVFALFGIADEDSELERRDAFDGLRRHFARGTTSVT